MKYRLICFIILVCILARPIQTIYEQRNKFLSTGYNAQYEGLRAAYLSSQYVKKENPGIIPDETFESYVGGALLRGVNPIHIVHEHPPMGRYIIAISIFLFDNASAIILPLLALSAYGVFLIAKAILGKTLFALLPLALYVNEPLLISKLVYSPLLEPIQLTFIVWALYFFIRKWFLLTSLMNGFVISIRFFILGAVEVFAMILFFILQRRFDKNFKYFLVTMPISLVVLLIAYTKTMLEGYSIWQIFGVQKYIFFYHNSKFGHPFSFWDLLLFNRWHTWWGEQTILQDSQWIIFWPIAAGLTALFLITALLKKFVLNDTEKIVFLWVGMYCLLLSIGFSTTRYFLPLVPFLYILAVDFLLRVFRRYAK